MPAQTAAQRFFSDLSKVEHVSLLEGTSGILLVELGEEGAEPQRWFVRIERGDIGVSQESATPDCILSTDAPTFEAIVTGEINAFAAMLRGLLAVDGQIHLLVALQAFFRPSGGALDQPEAGYAGRGR